MERLTFDGNFCDIAQCSLAPCEFENGCAQKQVWGRLKQYEDTGLTPEEINDLSSVQEISPEAEYAINKHADRIIERLDKLLAQTDDDRLCKLAKADKEGRVVVRCRDCEYVRPTVSASTGERVGIWCALHDIINISPDDYCSRGLRKGGNDNVSD